MKMRSRTTQGVILATSIFLFNWIILIVANVAPYDRQCVWQFPKILSCLLTAHENLVAGLTAAGGALFAAWLAWSAVRDQIDFDSARDAALRDDVARGRVERAKIELIGLQLTTEHIDKLISRFRGVDASSQWTYVDDLRNLSHAGGLSFFSQPLPPPLAGKAAHLHNKMKEMAARIDSLDVDPKLRQSDAPNAITPTLRKAYIDLDREIKVTLDEHISLRGEFAVAIIKCDEIIARGA